MICQNEKISRQFLLRLIGVLSLCSIYFPWVEKIEIFTFRFICCNLPYFPIPPTKEVLIINLANGWHQSLLGSSTGWRNRTPPRSRYLDWFSPGVQRLSFSQSTSASGDQIHVGPPPPSTVHLISNDLSSSVVWPRSAALPDARRDAVVKRRARGTECRGVGVAVNEANHALSEWSRSHRWMGV